MFIRSMYGVFFLFLRSFLISLDGTALHILRLKQSSNEQRRPLKEVSLNGISDLITDKKVKNLSFIENTDGVAFRAAGLLNVVLVCVKYFIRHVGQKNN